MNDYFERLRTHIAENPPDFGDGESALTLLYEAYADSNKMDDGTIWEDFNELYRQMNGMELRERWIRSSILSASSVGITSGLGSLRV